jgi:hypothetical protein
MSAFTDDDVPGHIDVENVVPENQRATLRNDGKNTGEPDVFDHEFVLGSWNVHRLRRSYIV